MVGEFGTWCSSFKIKAAMLHEDCSSNARPDTLDKYSRFFGKSDFSDWCNEPTLKYTGGFRDLIYQVNPHYISCVYKKMFDACATNQLRIVDDDGIVDDDRDEVSGNPAVYGQENITPRSVLSEPVDFSNSCVYGQSTGTVGPNCVKNAAGKCKHLCGWLVCAKRHKASCYLTPTVVPPETKPSCRRPSVGRAASPKTFQESLRHVRQDKSPAKARHGPRYRSASVSEGVHRNTHSDLTDESTGRQCGGSVSCISAINSPIRVGKSFKHFKRYSSYIDQYREEYTYTRLYETVEKRGIILHEQQSLCSCGNTACTGTHSQSPADCGQRWYPHQSHSTEKAQSVTSGVHSPKWPHVLKTRPQNAVAKPARVPVHVLQIPQLEEFQRKGTPWAKDLKQKMGFFATSLTINNYNPTQPPSPCLQPRCSSSLMPPVVSSKSGGLIKKDRKCPPASPIQDRHLNQNIKSAL